MPEVIKAREDDALMYKGNIKVRSLRPGPLQLAHASAGSVSHTVFFFSLAHAAVLFRSSSVASRTSCSVGSARSRTSTR